MKYLDEFRDVATARGLAAAIRAEASKGSHTGRNYRLMEFCGGHTHAIFRYGIRDLMPDNLRFLHGPGCPVCVLPASRIEAAIHLAEDEDIILCTYADLMRVPTGKRDSLHKAKARGADIRVVYAATDALNLARSNPDRQVVFFAIGFETTTPPSAAVLKMAREMGLANFSVYCNHVLTPPAMEHILDAGEARIDGILGPSHVSTVIGSRAYAGCSERYAMPIVIAGFEPLDVLAATLMLLRQINSGRHIVENQYSRVVSKGGNKKAQALMHETFELRPCFEWRGLGELADSALRIRPNYADFDAERRFAMHGEGTSEVKGCICPAVLRGVSDPDECRLFATACTPEEPKGACMVSAEGACAAYYSYGRRAA